MAYTWTLSNEDRELLSALQIAILGYITPNIRAIGARTSANHHHFNVYVDGSIDDELIEDMSEVETQLYAHYPAEHQVTHEIVRLDAPNRIPGTYDSARRDASQRVDDHQWFAYFRKERD